MSWLYYPAKVMVWSLFLLTRRRVRGVGNVPSQGAVLIVANHIGLADPPLIGLSLGRKVAFMAKEELFRSRLVSYLLHGLGAFPVYRRRLDRRVLQRADQLLMQGQALLMFPEGSRSLNARLQPALPGSARIATRNGTPILPVAVTGTEKIHGLAWILRRPRITVNIGQPFHLSLSGGKLNKQELAEITSTIMGHISELLPPEYQGVYSRTRSSGDVKD